MRFRKPGLTHRFLVLGLAAAAPAALALGLLVPGAVQATVAPASSSVTDYVTFYGWVDNSPPSADRPSLHPPGGRRCRHLYQPGHLRGAHRPARTVVPDHLRTIPEEVLHSRGPVQSVWRCQLNHVDLWMGGDQHSKGQPEKKALLKCEDQWTQHNTVILHPPSTEPVDTTPLFTPPTTCHGGIPETAAAEAARAPGRSGLRTAHRPYRCVWQSLGCGRGDP